jgi:hypothetical protein
MIEPRIFKILHYFRRRARRVKFAVYVRVGHHVDFKSPTKGEECVLLVKELLAKKIDLIQIK